MRLCLTALCCTVFAASVSELEQARDRQDRAALDRLIQSASAKAAGAADSAAAHYELAVAQSYMAQVATEQKDKNRAYAAAEAGIKAAERAVALDGRRAEYHRVLGTLCGQIIPARLISALAYGRCAKESIEKAIQLDPRSALGYLSRGVGNYYLPPSFGGGVERAMVDFRKAIALDPRLADAHLWLGIALRESNQNAEARKELTKAVELNPARVWAKQQLEKTPSR